MIGGGAIGLACAWRIAQRGLAVTVVDPAPGSGASRAAAGMLCPVTEVHYGEEPLLALTLESSRRWPGFAAEVQAGSDIDIGYRTEGTLAVALDADDSEALEALFRFQQSLGLTVERSRPRDCRKLEPRLSPRIASAAYFGADHQVDNRSLVAALLALCERCNVEILRQRVTSIGGAGVHLEDGRVLRSGHIVLAAGCWSSGLDSEVPTRPVKGQILRLMFDPADPPLVHNVRGMAEGRSVYLVPRSSGELVVGATVEELGFDTTVTAGAVLELLRAATELVPAVGELRLIETTAGLRPGTPDNAPVIGPSERDPRVIHATGHYRNGILLTPVTADAVAALVSGDTPVPEVAPFSARRFRR